VSRTGRNATCMLSCLRTPDRAPLAGPIVTVERVGWVSFIQRSIRSPFRPSPCGSPRADRKARAPSWGSAATSRARNVCDGTCVLWMLSPYCGPVRPLPLWQCQARARPRCECCLRSSEHSLAYAPLFSRGGFRWWRYVVTEVHKPTPHTVSHSQLNPREVPCTGVFITAIMKLYDKETVVRLLEDWLNGCRVVWKFRWMHRFLQYVLRACASRSWLSRRDSYLGSRQENAHFFGLCGLPPNRGRRLGGAGWRP
jgi:hypothetical protein